MLPQEHNENTVELDTTEGQPTMLGRGQRRKEISVRLRDYVTHTIQIMSPSMPSPLASQRSSGLLGARPASVPLEQNHRLALSTSSVLEDPERYRRLVGRLIYLCFTRPDLSYSVHVEIARAENVTLSLTIQVGLFSNITDILLKNISQGWSEVGLGCSLPGNNYPHWLVFENEGSSVSFTVSQVVGCCLKGMIFCIIYSSPQDSVVSVYPVSVMIKNFTKASIEFYKRDAATTCDDEEWQNLMCNLEPGNEMEVIVAFAHKYTVKKTAIYLVYGEEFDRECTILAVTNLLAIERFEIEMLKIERPEIERPEIEMLEIERPEIEMLEIERPEIEMLEIERPEIEMLEIERPEIEILEIERLGPQFDELFFSLRVFVKP
ncbi:TMV resistance protein N-like [Senna tora]|uniref:TMV resistance protein N-like n=1 Tax=Senna tora TaxID=362788 RepID=A0A835CKS5_9FABA|nr:TMV resistance protein N-like [Senna tora]